MGLGRRRGCRRLAIQLHPLLGWWGPIGGGAGWGEGLWANQGGGGPSGAGLAKGRACRRPAVLPSIGVGNADQRQGWPGGGAVGGWPPAPTLDRAGLLTVVGVIVTGHSGRYSILVAGFIYKTGFNISSSSIFHFHRYKH